MPAGEEPESKSESDSFTLGGITMSISKVEVCRAPEDKKSDSKKKVHPIEENADDPIPDLQPALANPQTGDEPPAAAPSRKEETKA